MFAYRWFNSILFFTIVLFIFGCKGEESPTKVIEIGNKEIKLEVSLSTSKKTVQPGDVALVKATVKENDNDSLIAVGVDWSSSSEDVTPVVQEAGVVAITIPVGFGKESVTVTADFQPYMMDGQAYTNNNDNIESIEINIDKSGQKSTEEVSGRITSDTVWASDTIYQFKKDLSIENGARLTIEEGAIVYLNNHQIISENGSIAVNGTSGKKVKIISSGLIKVPHFEANYLQVVKNRESLSKPLYMRGSFKISNSELYGQIEVTSFQISNSNISALAHIEGDNERLNVSEIINSSIHNLFIVPNGHELSVENNKIFHMDVGDQNIEVDNNNISYLRFTEEGQEGGAAIFRENNILSIAVRKLLSTQFKNNNIGVVNDTFFKDEELIIHLFSPVEFKETITLNSSGQFEVETFNLSNNYWAPEILEEMEEKGAGANISYIHDYYDDSDLDKVIYKDWVEEPFVIQ